MKDLGKRLYSGIIGLLLLILVVNMGGLILSVSLLILSLIGIGEFFKAVKNLKLNPFDNIGYLGCIIIFLADLFPSIERDLVITLMLIIMLLTLLFGREKSTADIGITLLGIMYMPFMLFHISYLEGTKYIWLIFLIAFGTDTFAYFTGNLFGKHKLSPKISPNKTIEGSIGGIIGSLIITILYALYVDITPLWKLVIMAVLTSIVSQLGDLVASKIKRMTGIKDYGKLMPGHGGVLDRFDSIILTAPLIYYFVRYFL
ncbi:phosphatidate cytidylyltransferase [Tissierella creatinini]|nr:phosphatidate cytidylyltransferase [Tissierella creatinini]TJX69158.1 phosphatidate cytidylyltransferase [Soehngenia saccharolytica]